VGKWERGKVGKSETAAPLGSEPAHPDHDACDHSRVTRFEDLRVWQSARRLARGIYRASRTQLLKDDYVLREQMKRAVVSIGSNIAEGYERGTRKQHIEGRYLAKGSAGELRSQILTARDVGLLDERTFTWLYSVCEQCSRQLAMYIAHLQRTQARIRGTKYAGQTLSRASSDAERHPESSSSPPSHLPEGSSRPPSHLPTLPPSHSSGVIDGSL